MLQVSHKKSNPLGHNFGIVGVADRCFGGNYTVPVKLHKCAVHSLHTCLGLKYSLDLMRFLLSNHCPDRAVYVHYLESGDKYASHSGDKLLRHHSPQYHGKLDAYLVLLICGENVDDPVHRVRRAVGVQGGQHKLSCFRGCHGDVYGLKIAHFPHEDNVGSLPQSRTQSVYVAVCVNVYLALADDTFFVLVQEFNGILDSDYVSLAV